MHCTASGTDARRRGEPDPRPSPPTPAAAGSSGASAGRGTTRTHTPGRDDYERDQAAHDERRARSEAEPTPAAFERTARAHTRWAPERERAARARKLTPPPPRSRSLG